MNNDFDTHPSKNIPGWVFCSNCDLKDVGPYLLLAQKAGLEVKFLDNATTVHGARLSGHAAVYAKSIEDKKKWHDLIGEYLKGKNS